MTADMPSHPLDLIERGAVGKKCTEFLRHGSGIQVRFRTVLGMQEQPSLETWITRADAEFPASRKGNGFMEGKRLGRLLQVEYAPDLVERLLIRPHPPEPISPPYDFNLFSTVGASDGQVKLFPHQRM